MAKFSQPKENLSLELEYSLQRLIESEMEMTNLTERLAEEISRRFDFNACDVYQVL